MEEPLIIVSHESSIMVSGEAPRQSRGFLWAGLALVVAVVVGVVFFLFFILQSVVLPKNTFFLTSVRPSHLTVSPEIEAKLPSEWREAVSSRSTWPVILGATYENGHFQAFSLVPAWTAPKRTSGTKAAVFMRRLDEGNSAVSTETVRYVSFLRRKVVLNFHPWGDGLGSITFLPQKNGVWLSDTTAALPPPASAMIPSQADAHFPLSFTRISDVAVFPLGEGLMKILSQTSDVVDLFLPDASSTTGYIFSAKDRWSEDQLRMILSKLGVTGRVSRELPDGSSANFLLPPNAASTTFPLTVHRPPYGDVVLTEGKVWLNRATSTELTPLTPKCEGVVPVARLSSRMVQGIMRGIVGPDSAIVWPGIQIGVEKNRLQVCPE